MKRRRFHKIDDVNENISTIVSNSSSTQLNVKRMISVNLDPIQKLSIITFIYNYYEANKHNIWGNYREEVYELVEDIIHGKIPVDTKSFINIKEILFKQFDFLSE